MNRTLPFLLLLTACGPSKGEDSGLIYTWPGGTFDFSSTAVADTCLDGGFVALFLPEGEGTTSAWAYPIEIPSWDTLESPQVYTISLQEPFTEMEVTVTRGDYDGQVVLEGARQNDVLFNEEQFDDCTVDMVIDALIILDGPQNVHGIATLSIEASNGSTCPEFLIPCDVTLDFSGLATE